jgi:hypothetical protein
MQYSIIERRANELQLYYNLSPVDAMRAAYNEAQLKKGLATQAAVYFDFVKKDGTLRSVLATKAESLIPEELKPNGKGAAYTSLQVRFLDASISEWRSCRIDRIVKIHW